MLQQEWWLCFISQMAGFGMAFSVQGQGIGDIRYLNLVF